jgi:hypothetical protein
MCHAFSPSGLSLGIYTHYEGRKKCVLGFSEKKSFLASKKIVQKNSFYAFIGTLFHLQCAAWEYILPRRIEKMCFGDFPEKGHFGL